MIDSEQEELHTPQGRTQTWRDIKLSLLPDCILGIPRLFFVSRSQRH